MMREPLNVSDLLGVKRPKKPIKVCKIDINAEYEKQKY